MAETAMTVREVAAYLNVNEKTVYRLAQKREIPGFKVAGAWRFRPEDIDRWIATQTADALAGAEPSSVARAEAEPQQHGRKRKSR
jgi:excisionase family DNA binding protein